MKLVNTLPNMVTSLSLSFGLYALIQTSDGNFILAGWLIAFSMIFDSLDGKLARRLGVSSELGAEI
ncbi:MAG: CDP-alcohol phosphatidyltransferase family protein, partial [Candidatus Cloacimonadota bacterium]|nr:CDP-alcohol phosphatidyltransferase family protein [Candidatus Cloacimonadota bacterium]